MNHNYLDDREKELVATFAENKQMLEAVRKVLLAVVGSNGTLRQGEEANFLQNMAFGLVSKRGNFTNEQLGQDLRAIWEGGAMVEAGFERIQSDFKKTSIPKKGQKNPAI